MTSREYRRLGKGMGVSEFVCLHDRAVIEEFLRRDTDLHLYELGDLDEFFWPQTLWFARYDQERLVALALLYVGLSQPVLLALGPATPLRELIRSISGVLPPWFYAHVSIGAEDAFQEKFQIEPHGTHIKMTLKDQGALRAAEPGGSVRLGPEHLAEVLQLYAESYPGNWFDPRMLETRECVGIRDGSRLVSIAGLHAYSPVFRVATLGNITTASSHRKRGLATRVTRDLCRSLLKTVDHIGLNVAIDNHAALSCYRKLGFEIVATYREFSVNLRL